jgi:hypothetical protein
MHELEFPVSKYKLTVYLRILCRYIGLDHYLMTCLYGNAFTVRRAINLCFYVRLFRLLGSYLLTAGYELPAGYWLVVAVRCCLAASRLAATPPAVIEILWFFLAPDAPLFYVLYVCNCLLAVTYLLLISACCQLLLFFQVVPLSCLFEPLKVAGCRLTVVFCVQANGVWIQIHTVYCMSSWSWQHWFQIAGCWTMQLKHAVGLAVEAASTLPFTAVGCWRLKLHASCR